MRVVVQRVAWAKVWAGDQEAAIGRGMLVLAGLEVGDTPETTDWVARKLVGLRIFEDAEGRMNLGLAETGGEILAVSQFTLAGSVVRGRRPSFDGAMAPEAARALFETFGSSRICGVTRQTAGFLGFCVCRERRPGRLAAYG